MSDTIASVFAIALIFIGLPVVLLWVRDRKRRVRSDHEHPPALRIEERRTYERRILHPDWVCVERHLRRPAPKALFELYADHTLITVEDLNYSSDHTISTFLALDEQAVAETQSWLGFEAIAIASTDSGDFIYLRPGAAQDDTVYITYHDGGDTEAFAATIAEMLKRLRRSNAAPDSR